MPELICPVCQNKYSGYKDYFKCWTSHLEKKIHYSSKNPKRKLEHQEALKTVYQNPSLIEGGMIAIAQNVQVFRGTIDLVLRDKFGKLCLVHINTTDKRCSQRKLEQMKRYRGNLKWIATQLFKIDLPESRLFLFHPNKGPQEVF